MAFPTLRTPSEEEAYGKWLAIVGSPLFRKNFGLLLIPLAKSPLN
jgi:hypothetical protein